MPTGLTNPIYEGKEDYTFEKFAMRCARTFGACLDLRDEPLDMEIDLDKHFQPSDYYKKELERVEKAYKDFLDNPPTEEMLSVQYDEEVARQQREYQENVEKCEAVRQRYSAMLQRVNDWVPPTEEHYGLKDFMIKQLQGSIDFDCKVYEPKPDTREDYIEYYMSPKRFIFDIEHYKVEHQKEVDACNKRKEWVMQLMESLQ